MAKASVIIALAMLGLCAAQTAIGTHDVPPAPRDDYATCQPSPHALDNVLYLEEFDRFVTRTPIDCDERSDGGCPEPDYMLGTLRGGTSAQVCTVRTTLTKRNLQLLRVLSRSAAGTILEPQRRARQWR